VKLYSIRSAATRLKRSVIFKVLGLAFRKVVSGLRLVVSTTSVSPSHWCTAGPAASTPPVWSRAGSREFSALHSEFLTVHDVGSLWLDHRGPPGPPGNAEDCHPDRGCSAGGARKRNHSSRPETSQRESDAGEPGEGVRLRIGEGARRRRRRTGPLRWRRHSKLSSRISR
jgi:hypothetical protein